MMERWERDARSARLRAKHALALADECSIRPSRK
jgi:hypothetical protein